MEHHKIDGLVGRDVLSIGVAEDCLQSPERPGHKLSDSPPTQGEQNETGASNNSEVDEVSKLPLSKARCIALVVTVTGASFLNALSTQSIVVILPAIGKDLGIPESRQQWLVSSYALAFGCFLLVWGRIADIYGKRLIFILGSAFVIPVTAINPVIPNEIAFNLFRGLQGFVSYANCGSCWKKC
jgi:Na+/melibiose symporter-like transporter